MDIKVFSKEDNAEPTEIGIASRVRFSYHGVLPAGVMYASPGQALMDVPLSHGQQVEVFLNDWKTPAPVLPQFTGGPSLNRQLQDMQRIIAILVNMMGGAVTIQSHEADNVDPESVEALYNHDPEYLILRVKENK